MANTPTSLASVARVLRTAGLIDEIHGPEDVYVSGVSQDSRSMQNGDLFLAWHGSDWDAHDFVAPAAQAGAVAAVVERHVPEAGIPQLQVSDGRRAAALAADVLLGSPWESLFTVGVTGTNGKTTTAMITRHLLQDSGTAVAIGTLGLVETDGSVRAGTEGLTTPGPVELSTWLAGLADAGVDSVALEASSHALEQKRLDGVRFDAVVFTNLTQDHLDYHPDMASYLTAKSHLLNLMKAGGLAVVNADADEWRTLPTEGCRTLTYGVDSPADLRAEALEPTPDGTRFRIVFDDQDAEVNLPLLGRFNVENSLAAAGVGWAAGMDVAAIGARLETVPQIPGRLEIVATDPFSIVIDFAHTAEALRGVLTTLRARVPGRLIVVFGAGGDRDRGKRPEMGAVVAEGADLAVVTSDNPRTEDPESIIDDIVAGMPEASYQRHADRREAISLALTAARDGDLVLLAGKGHESYQVIGTESCPFDERVVVQESLGRLGGAA
jgi:UDP-N-acetylmuramoyl-L-alanyl-D-glutamate--2,6-diaminopimelate ligase